MEAADVRGPQEVDDADGPEGRVGVLVTDRSFAIAAAAVGAAFVGLNLDALASEGVRYGGDSPRFLAGADALTGDAELRPEHRVHLGYVALVALSHEMGLRDGGVIALQLLAAAAAALALYDLGRRIGGRWAGLAVAALFVTTPDFTRVMGWHAFVLTDSLYVSGVVLVTWSTVRAAERPRPGRLAALGLLLLAIGSLRPQGWLLVPLALGCLALVAIDRRRVAWAVVASVCVALALTARGVGADASPTFARPDRALLTGQVYYGREGAREMPGRAPSRPGWRGVVEFAFEHPLATAELTARRVGGELAHVRPNWSAAHNAAALGSVLPVHVLAGVGLVLLRRRWEVRFLAAVVVAHLAVVAFFWGDVDGRFLLHVLPLLQLLAVWGAVAALRRSHTNPTWSRVRESALGRFSPRAPMS